MIFLFLLPLVAATPCETYSSPSVCANCLTGFRRDRDSLCVPSASPRAPIENCLDMSDPSTCSLCAAGYSLLSNRCFPVCAANCSCFAPSECLSLSSRSLFSSCFSSNCKTCNSHRSACAVCNPSYGLINGFCLACTIPNCTVCNANLLVCTACVSNFTLRSGLCWSSGTTCDSLCTNCVANVCLACPSGYVAVGANCENCSDANCASCYNINSGECYACNSGFFASHGLCYACSANCKSCLSASSCDACEEGYLRNQKFDCVKEEATGNNLGTKVGVPVGIAVGAA
jgi:hypothetical protein